MKHDPEKNAATYLSSEMSRRRRKAFEQHILECEDCWSEVDVGRRGRSLAEAARVLAPHKLRDRVRMSVEAMPSPRRRWRFAMGGFVVAVALIGATTALGILDRPEQPEEIAILLADFESGSALEATTARKLPARLGDLELRHSRAGRVRGMEVTAHSYVDPAGHEVTVYQADSTFPVAAGAQHARAGETWSADVDGAALFCADHPVPSLVVGDDRKEVTLAADELGLR